MAEVCLGFPGLAFPILARIYRFDLMLVGLGLIEFVGTVVI